MPSYLLIASRFLTLDRLMELVEEEHPGLLPEIEPPEGAPVTIGARLCLDYDKLPKGLCIWSMFRSNRDFQAHLIYGD